jgi:hypothetical protein
MAAKDADTAYFRRKMLTEAYLVPLPVSEGDSARRIFVVSDVSVALDFETATIRNSRLCHGTVMMMSGAASRNRLEARF